MVRAGYRERLGLFSLSHVMWVCRRTSASDRKLRSFVRSLFRCCTARAPPPAPAAASRTYPRSPRCLVSRLASWYSCASPHWCYKYAIRSLTPSLSLAHTLTTAGSRAGLGSNPDVVVTYCQAQARLRASGVPGEGPRSCQGARCRCGSR